MLESDTPFRTFIGVRFSLYGFDSVNEHKIRVKLINGGGVGVGQYSHNCTHLIVDKIVYDDPVCVAARNEGKTVVTGLWVDHSFDIGMPVDATSIMYRPLKDLNGIPGAQSLIICLTGYQRQDREDIMTMVGLMGARFSKPLVANKVTHLICYKFGGEKYELAKKTMSIKLINHRWLEDCLTEWELLSEANYSTSGHDLEVMEAEVKDSDEEVEEATLMHSGQKSLNRNPHNLKAAFVSSSALPSKVEVSTSTLPRHSPNTKEVLLTPGKSHPGTSFNNVKDHELYGFQDTGLRNISTIKLAQPGNRSPNSTNMDNNLVSSSKSPLLSRKAISYSRKTPRTSPRKATAPNLHGEVSGNISGSPQAMKPMKVSDNSSSKMQESEEKTCSLVRSPKEGSALRRGVDSVGILPQKRALELSGSSSKSKKMSHYAKASTKSSALDTGRLDPTSFVGDQPLINDYSVNETGYPNVLNSSPAGNATTKLSTDRFPSITLTTEDGQNGSEMRLPVRGSTVSPLAGEPNMRSENGYEKSPQMSFKGLREPTTASISNIGDYGLEQFVKVVGEPDEPQNKPQDVEVPSLDDRKLGKKDSHSPSNLDVLEGGNDKSVTKQVSKKKLVKKTPGSRTKLSNIANVKGSIYPSKLASKTHSTIYLDGDNERATHTSVSELETCSPTINLDAAKDVVEEVTNCQTTAASKTHLMDDETQAPDEEEYNDSKKTTREEKSELVELTRKADMLVEGEHVRDDSKVAVHGSSIASENRTDGADPERAVGSQNSEFGEPTIECDGLEKKVTKRKKQLAGRARMKAVPSNSKNDMRGENTSVEKNVEQKEIGKENLMLHPDKVAVHGSSIASENKTDGADPERAVGSKNPEFGEPTIKSDGLEKKVNKRKKQLAGRARMKAVPSNSKNDMVGENTSVEKNVEQKEIGKENLMLHPDKVAVHGSSIASENRTGGADPERAVGSKNSEFGEPTIKCDGLEKKVTKRTKQLAGRARVKAVPSNSKNDMVGENTSVEKNVEQKEIGKENIMLHPDAKPSSNNASSKAEFFGASNSSKAVRHKEVAENSVGKPNNRTVKSNEKLQKIDYNRQPLQMVSNGVKAEPLCFILSGHRLQRKEFQQVIRGLKGKFCRDSHQWSYQATHFIAPDPIRRTEKFFAAVASGRWILNPDFLSACNQAGKFLAEEPYEWHKNGLSEDGAINLEAPRKWRQVRERTGHGAFYGMRIVVYGECIAPPLDTLKRVVKAGDGDLLATSPPYTRFLKSGVDFAVVSPGMPRVDMWVQEFLKHEIPCIVADYLVEYVCKPGYSLDKHVLYNTHEWAEKSFTKLTSQAEEIIEDSTVPQLPDDSESDDITCEVCGSADRGEVMLICGNENGSEGCGIGTHIDCCDPPLDNVPEDDWFCPKCSERSLNNTSSKKRKKGTSRSKGR